VFRALAVGPGCDAVDRLALPVLQADMLGHPREQ
jgi:hypothetical protein